MCCVLTRNIPEGPELSASLPESVKLPDKMDLDLDLSDVLAITPAPLIAKPTEPVTKSTKLLFELSDWASMEPAVMFAS